MICKPERDAQPEKQLRDLGRGVAEMPALAERPEAEREFNSGGVVERDVEERKPPPPDMIPEPPLHQVVGNIAERVIEEVREDVSKHDQAAGKANLPHADAAQPRQRVNACRLHVTQSWRLDCHEVMARAAPFIPAPSSGNCSANTRIIGVNAPCARTIRRAGI